MSTLIERIRQKQEMNAQLQAQVEFTAEVRLCEMVEAFTPIRAIWDELKDLPAKSFKRDGVRIPDGRPLHARRRPKFGSFELGETVYLEFYAGAVIRADVVDGRVRLKKLERNQKEPTVFQTTAEAEEWFVEYLSTLLLPVAVK